VSADDGATTPPSEPDADGAPGPTGGSDATPLLRVVSPNATPEEVAALVAVLASMGGDAAAPPRGTPEWQSHHRKLRVTFPHGSGGWRASGLPR
jgi:hypothetical protein